MGNRGKRRKTWNNRKNEGKHRKNTRKQGVSGKTKTRENRGNRTKTRENRENIEKLGKQGKTQKNTGKQGVSEEIIQKHGKTGRIREKHRKAWENKGGHGDTGKIIYILGTYYGVLHDILTEKKKHSKLRSRTDLEISRSHSALTSSNSRIKPETYRLSINLVQKNNFGSVVNPFLCAPPVK